ncbi:MAG: FAD-dependent oxidoreductase [Acidimicrobiia bacterium]|nr:FAD-dependent oxidoreductase [Acidimicrobiia bacterium]
MSYRSSEVSPPVRSLPRNADVVVVGGGVVGLCSAYELAAHGRQVVVIDEGPIARGSAAGNAGLITPSHLIPMAAPGVMSGVVRGMIRRTGPVTVRPSIDPSYLRWMVRFARNCNSRAADAGTVVLRALGFRSADLVAEWIERDEIKCDYRKLGLLYVYGDEAAFAAGRHEAETMERYGVTIERYDTAQIRELEPALNEEVLGGFRCVDDAGLDPARFMSGIVSVLSARGVVFVPHTRLLDFRTSGGTVDRLVTSRGDLTADEVVIATGAWTPRVASLLGESVPIQAGKGYSMTVAAPRQGPRNNLLIGDRWVAVNPIGDKLRLSGWLELGRLDTRPSLRRLAQVEANARSRVRLDPELTVLERWAGLRPVTPDGLPMIGRSSGWRNVTYAVGHGKLGLSHGPLTGRLVAQIICDRPTDLDLEPFSPRRFG